MLFFGADRLHRGDGLRKKLPIKTQQTGSASVVGKGGWGRKKVDYFCGRGGGLARSKL